MLNTVNNNQYVVSNGGIKQEKLQNAVTKSTDAAVDSFESNSIVQTGLGGNSDDKRKTMMLLPALVFVNKFIDRLMGGPEDANLLKKVANAGDRISHTLHLDNVLSAQNESKFAKKIKNNKFTKYFTSEFAAVPKSSFAKSEPMASSYSKKLKEEAGKIVSEVVSKNYGSDAISSNMGKLSKETVQFLKDVSPELNDAYLDRVKSAVIELSANASTEAEKTVLKNLTDSLTAFGASESNISAEKMFKQISSNLGALKETNTVQKASAETKILINSLNKEHTTEQILGAVEDLAANGIDLKNTSTLTSIRNKCKVANKQMGETLLGKSLAKGTLKTKDILTYGGDILSLWFAASALIQAGSAAKEAPKGEKKSTFMHVLSENYIGFALLQPCTKLLYKIGGNKYRGMDLAGRNALKDLVATANSNPNLTKEGLKIANIQKKLLLKGVDASKVSDIAGMGLKEAKEAAKNLGKQGSKISLWEKPLKFAGKILGTGLDDIKIHKKVNLPLLGEKLMARPTLKGFLGGFGRLALIMFVLQPFISKPVTKLVHKIFGEPKTYLAKQEKNNNSTNEKSQSQNGVQNQNTVSPNNNSNTNLINQWASNQNVNQPATQTTAVQMPSTTAPAVQQPQVNPQVSQQAAQPVNQQQAVQNTQDTALPSAKISDNNSKSGRYIPSIEVNYTDSSGEAELDKHADEVIKRTDSLIKNVQKSLR